MEHEPSTQRSARGRVLVVDDDPGIRDMVAAMLQIHGFKPEAECDLSGKVGEAVEISTDDGSIQHAVICMAELTKLLRFRRRQQDKQKGTNGADAA